MNNPTQKQLYHAAERKAAEFNLAMLDMLYGENPITDDELRALIVKRPLMYGRFAGYLGKRSQKEQGNEQEESHR